MLFGAGARSRFASVRLCVCAVAASAGVLRSLLKTSLSAARERDGVTPFQAWAVSKGASLPFDGPQANPVVCGRSVGRRLALPYEQPDEPQG